MRTNRGQTAHPGQTRAEESTALNKRQQTDAKPRKNTTTRAAQDDQNHNAEAVVASVGLTLFDLLECESVGKYDFSTQVHYNFNFAYSTTDAFLWECSDFNTRPISICLCVLCSLFLPPYFITNTAKSAVCREEY